MNALRCSYLGDEGFPSDWKEEGHARLDEANSCTQNCVRVLVFHLKPAVVIHLRSKWQINKTSDRKPLVEERVAKDFFR